MKIFGVNTTTALALFFIAFAIMLIGALDVISPSRTIIQEAQAQQQTRKEASTEATEDTSDGPLETLTTDNSPEGGGGEEEEEDAAAADADNEQDTVTICIGIPPNQMTQKVTLGEAQFLEETIPENELSYGICNEG
jgi:flagellar biosynthesis/type III secretory pathway M-ring protein FliF/YscJ